MAYSRSPRRTDMTCSVLYSSLSLLSRPAPNALTVFSRCSYKKHPKKRRMPKEKHSQKMDRNTLGGTTLRGHAPSILPDEAPPPYLSHAFS